jgi:hypothetical protein
VATKEPRPSLTDVGDVEAALNIAQRRWPEATDRDGSIAARTQRRERQRAAMQRGRDLLHVDALRSDAAWR